MRSDGLEKWELSKQFFYLLLPIWCGALEVQPWFGDVFEFHYLASYSYSRFTSVQNAVPQLTRPFNCNVLYNGFDFSPTPEWGIDLDLQFAATTKEPFNFRTVALQARYLWLDDIVGDPISLATGASVRTTATRSLKDVSCPYYGNVDFEVNFALGKEWDSIYWRFRAWGYGALGHSNRGSPWVRAMAAFETNYDDTHKFAFIAEGTNGYGRHTRIDPNHFFGYARVREKNIDLCFRYGYRMGVWGTLRFEYDRRVLAKSCPAKVNTFTVAYLLPFCF